LFQLDIVLPSGEGETIVLYGHHACKGAIVFKELRVVVLEVHVSLNELLELVLHAGEVPELGQTPIGGIRKKFYDFVSQVARAIFPEIDLQG